MKKDKLEIVKEDHFQNLKKQVEEDRQNAVNNPHLTISLKEFEKEMENTIKKYGA